MRRDTNPDTPLPPEEPVGENPPSGAILDYVLPAGSTGPVTLAIYDAAGGLVRSYASGDRPAPIEPEIVVPTYWLAPPARLSAAPGAHRFIWDLHATAPHALEGEYPISAIPYGTPLDPQGPLVPPGRYEVRLAAGSLRIDRPLVVQRDPRVTISGAAFAAQYAAASAIARAIDGATSAVTAARAKGDRAAASRYEKLDGGLVALLHDVESADAPPTAVETASLAALDAALARGGYASLDLGGAADEP